MFYAACLGLWNLLLLLFFLLRLGQEWRAERVVTTGVVWFFALTCGAASFMLYAVYAYIVWLETGAWINLILHLCLTCVLPLAARLGPRFPAATCEG